MTNDAEGGRRYDAAEADRILLRAAERQASADTGSAMSLRELERAGAEAGIDPALIRQAAVELAAPAAGGGGFVGAPTSATAAAEYAGEAGDAQVGELVEELRRVSGRQGHVERAGGSTTWYTRRGASELRVTIVAARGRTTVRATASFAEYAVGTHLGLVAGGGLIGGGSIAAAAWMAIGAGPAGAVVLGAVGAGYATARWMVRRRAAAARRELAAAMACAETVLGAPPAAG